MARVAIIGGGFTGLSSAIRLADSGIETVVFEKEKSLGGLAGSFKPDGWKWSLEEYYHHIFTNDKEIIAMAKKVGAGLNLHHPETTSFISGKEIRLDSPMSVLTFNKLSVFSRLWMGAGLLFLKLIPNGLFLEKYKAVKLLPWLIGKEGYRKIWERLLLAKFGVYAGRVNMAWFWTRVAKRTKNLGYFDGGFVELLLAMARYIEKNGGRVLMGKEVSGIKTKGDKVEVNGELFDKVIVTVPAPRVAEVAPDSKVLWPKIDYLWGQTLVLELDRGLIGGYWMNILEKDWPFLVAVEHTNMIDKKNYGDKVVVYLGNYLQEGDKRLGLNKDELTELFLPYLQKINKNFDKKNIIRSWSFRSPFAQPVFPVNYSRQVPGFATAQKGVYVANMSMVYPHDRGTNYAVKMGTEVAELVLKKL